MARDGQVRLRTPCTSWSSAARFGVVSRGQRRSFGSSSHREVRWRARAAGLEEGELDALEAAYARAHTRSWEAMRAACEEGPMFKTAIAESEVSSDADRVAICQASLLPDEPGARGAMRRVAEARAGGHGAPGASAEERVAYALSASVDVLFEEMTHALGREGRMTKTWESGHRPCDSRDSAALAKFPPPFASRSRFIVVACATCGEARGRTPRERSRRRRSRPAGRLHARVARHDHHILQNQ